MAAGGALTRGMITHMPAREPAVCELAPHSNGDDRPTRIVASKDKLKAA